MTDAEQIIALAKLARAESNTYINAISDEIEQIRRQAFDEGRPRTADEQETIARLDNAITEAVRARKEMEFTVLRDLNNSAAVREMAARIASIRDGVKRTSQRLNNLVRVTRTAAQVLEALAKIAAKAATMIP